MQKTETESSARQGSEINEELSDVLIAISVIAKRLAKKLLTQSQEKEK